MSQTPQPGVFTPKKRKLSDSTNPYKCYKCKSDSRSRRDVTFHSFPKPGKSSIFVTDAATGVKMKKDRLTAWCEFVGLQPREIHTHKLCSLHFAREDFFYGGAASWKTRKALKPTAVPSILNPRNEGYSHAMQRSGGHKCVQDATTEGPSERIAEVEVTSQMEHEAVPHGSSSSSLQDSLHLNFDGVSPMARSRSIGTQTDWATKDSDTQTAVRVAADAQTEVTSGDFKTTFSSFLDSDQKLNAFTVLGILFEISPTTVKNCFHEGLFVIHACVSNMLYWPTKEEVMSSMPLSFIQNCFANTRIILDGTEIKTTKTKCIKCRCRIFSFYKGCHTIKFMVGITPGGLIVYISKAYGGRASDKFIFMNSGLIQRLEPFVDSIMVDKGFLIQDFCAQHNIKVIMPHFLRKKHKFSKSEAKKNRKVAACRVHVERAIGRMKDFRILKDTLPWYLSGYAELIMKVIACMVNLSAPLISGHRFASPVQLQLNANTNQSQSFQSSLDLEFDADWEDIDVLEVSFQ